MKKRYFIPLLGFAVPSLVIGFGLVIPGSCIEGLNNLTVGFASTVAGASLTYWLGIRSVLTDLKPPLLREAAPQGVGRRRRSDPTDR